METKTAEHQIETEEFQTVNNKNARKSQLSVKKLWKNITLEPMLFLKMMAEGNMKVVVDTLQIHRVCEVNLNYSTEDCLSMDDGNHSLIQSSVQKYQNTFNYYQNLIDSLLPILIVLFAGSISDRFGRKLPMCSVLVGFVAYAAVCIATALNPSWPVEALYAATISVDITGSWVVFNMAVYSYMADITTVEKRTKRMGWMDASWYLGGPIGTLLGGWIYHHFGYVTVFAISGILWIFCLVYVILLVKESAVPSSSITTSGCCLYLKDLGQTLFRNYPFNGRFHLIALMALRLGVFLTHGHQVFLWARRVMGWDTAQFSTWNGADEAFHQAGMVIWVGFAAHYHFSGHTVAAVGLVSIGAWSVVLACIVGPEIWWLTIVATLLGSFEASIEPALRSLITSIPEKKDLGKILALLGLLESIWLTVDRSIFTALYNTFLESFPQINYVVECCITSFLLIAVLILKWDWFRQRASTANKVEEQKQEDSIITFPESLAPCLAP